MNIKWFATSPEEGPACTCSWCGKPILADEDDEGEPVELAEGESPAIRMWDQNTIPMLEARFHPRCLNQAIEAGELTLGEARP